MHLISTLWSTISK